MYVSPNFKYKKQLKEAIAAGKEVRVYEPGYQHGGPLTGAFSVEGPHFPQRHTWHATVKAEEGMVVKVL